MRQISGFQLLLVVVILAGVGVFAFSLLETTPDPPPPSRLGSEPPRVAVARESPGAPGASDGPAGAADELDGAATPARPDVDPEAARSASPPRSRPVPPVTDGRRDAPSRAGPESGLAREPASERSASPARRDEPASGGGSSPPGVVSAPSRAPSRSASADGGSGTAPAAATVAGFAGSPGPQSGSASEQDVGEDLRQPDAEPTDPQDQDLGGSGTAAPPGPTGSVEDDGDDEGDGDDDEDSPPVPSPLVQMEPSATDLLIGQSLAVRVRIFSGTDVGHVPFHVTYDKNVLQFDHGEEGPFLGSDGLPTAFFASATSTAGTVVVGLSRLGSGIPGVSGDGELCTLYFDAVGSGTTTLLFQRQKVRRSDHSIVPDAHFPPSGPITVD